MAEVAGLALGVVSISGLFSGCVELAEYISLSRSIGADYEALYTKFLLLKSRLIACGQPLQSTLDQSKDQNTRTSWHNSAARCLLAIKELLGNAQRLEQKYGLREEGEGEMVQRRLQQEHSTTLQEVERGLQASVKQRQQKTNLARKIVWAMRDKKAFDRLVADLAFLVDELEHLVIRSGGQSFPSMLPVIPQDMSPAAVQLLESASSGPDLSLPIKEGDEQQFTRTASPGHIYLRNQIKERARVLQGDVGECGPYSRQHTFADNVICGGSKVVQGNVAYDFMEDFWKD